VAPAEAEPGEARCAAAGPWQPGDGAVQVRRGAGSPVSGDEGRAGRDAVPGEPGSQVPDRAAAGAGSVRAPAAGARPLPAQGEQHPGSACSFADPRCRPPRPCARGGAPLPPGLRRQSAAAPASHACPALCSRWAPARLPAGALMALLGVLAAARLLSQSSSSAPWSCAGHGALRGRPSRRPKRPDRAGVRARSGRARSPRSGSSCCSPAACPGAARAAALRSARARCGALTGLCSVRPRSHLSMPAAARCGTRRGPRRPRPPAPPRPAPRRARARAQGARGDAGHARAERGRRAQARRRQLRVPERQGVRALAAGRGLPADHLPGPQGAQGVPGRPNPCGSLADPSRQRARRAAGAAPS